MEHIKLIIGDITRAQTDAIVNAANPAMLGGGGVDGALHRAAGPALLAACRQVAATEGVRCPIGEARITSAGELAARYVIHAVGPRYRIDPQPQALLASAYRHSLELALAHDCGSVALPAISCGVYGYPPREAARIALATANALPFRALALSFFLFDRAIYEEWLAEFQALAKD